MIKNKEYMDSVRKCYLFGGMDDGSIVEAITILKGRVKRYKRDELILRLDDDLIKAGLLLKGRIESSFQNESFNQITVNYLSCGEMFGEALVCSGIKNSPVQIRAVEDCAILFIDLKQIYNEEIKSDLNTVLAANLIKSLAGKNLILNQKIRILSQKGLRDRILIYLQTLPSDSNGYVRLPFTQTALAEYLGVNRSALSRELGRMQNEGVLKMSHDKLKLV